MGKTALGLLCMVVAATAFSGGRPRAWRPYSQAGQHPGRPECPHDWDFKAGQMTAVGPNINVPEFHDCQRFIRYILGQPRYDSLFAIFATDSLKNLDTLLTQLDTGGTGTVALAAAEVYAEGVYLELGIRTMFSCLYVYRTHGVWGAKMVPVGRAERDCSQPVNPIALPGITLEVRPKQIKGFSELDYPAVARWDWDREHHLQYIGIKCGAAWCEVGQRGFVSTPWQDLPLTVPPHERRTRIIKGWYDQQYLADTLPDGSTKPSTIWGSIYPDSGLDGYDTLNAFTPGNWVHVAEVALEDQSGSANPSNPYKKRRNLDLTQPGGRLNSIYLCRGKACVPSTPLICDGEGQWWAKVVGAMDTDGSHAKFMCAVRRPHDALGRHVVGTARWRWLASDETTWKRCDNGCCEVR
jgi:hypothetical protein